MALKQPMAIKPAVVATVHRHVALGAVFGIAASIADVDFFCEAVAAEENLWVGLAGTEGLDHRARRHYLCRLLFPR